MSDEYGSLFFFFLVVFALQKRGILPSHIYFFLYLSEMMEAFLMGWWKKMTKIKQKGDFLAYLR